MCSGRTFNKNVLDIYHYNICYLFMLQGHAAGVSSNAGFMSKSVDGIIVVVPCGVVLASAGGFCAVPTVKRSLSGGPTILF